MRISLNVRQDSMQIFRLVLLIILLFPAASGQTGRRIAPAKSRFRVLVLYQEGGHHVLYCQAARAWLDRLAADSNFRIDYFRTSDSLTDLLLSRYQLVVQLDYVPYGWTEQAQSAFVKYIEQGRGGWLGFHHASLLGDFDGYPMWPWFSQFLGGIRYVDYIPGFASAEVQVEDSSHPCMRGVPNRFLVRQDEWYTYDRSPRNRVHVLASVNESSYVPDSRVKMGDHPVIWTNERVASRNLYIFMGHSPDLFDNAAYTDLFRNAIFWAARK